MARTKHTAAEKKAAKKISSKKYRDTNSAAIKVRAKARNAECKVMRAEAKTSNYGTCELCNVRILKKNIDKHNATEKHQLAVARMIEAAEAS